MTSGLLTITLSSRAPFDLEISADSVRLVFTDPPYGLDFLPLWAELGTFAKKVLVSEGTCASYSGIAYLPDALQALAASLEYRWMCSIVHGGGGRPLFLERAAIQGWKPVLLFSKGKHRVCNAIEDTILGSGREKSHHPWQQRGDEAEKFISKLTDPGDVVCDPFLGSGTTALACKRLGRRFVGCDVDPDAVEEARSRLTEVVLETSPEKEVLEPCLA